MVQSVPTEGMGVLELTAVRFMKQIPCCPTVVWRRRRSLLPSPSKSPVSARVQADGTTPRPPVLRTVDPFISQMPVLPAVSRHTMSALPSPLKSPVPMTDQMVGRVGMLTVEDTETAGGVGVPPMNQMAFCPVVVLRHRMSFLPSPLKSAMPAMVHGAGTVPINVVACTVDPFKHQIAVLPAPSCQSRSPLASPLKSPVPTMDQPGATLPTMTDDVTVVPLR